MNRSRHYFLQTTVATSAVVCLLTFSETLYMQEPDSFVPVTDAMLENPADEDWLTWRRTTDSWGYSPLDQIDRQNVGDLRLVWTRGLATGRQEGTPLVYDGVLYMPQSDDVIEACLLYTSPSPRDGLLSRMPSSA